MSDTVVLAYWNTRCLAEPIRLMLEYLGIKFTDKRYPVGEAPNYDKTEWKNDKHSMDFSFPNLPYLIDGNIKIAESWAILKYLARKSKCLFPKSEDDIISCDTLEGFLEDFRSSFINLTYYSTPDNFQTNIDGFKVVMYNKLSLIESFLSDFWLTGETLMYVDFVLFETLDQIDMFNADHSCYNIDDYPKLKDFMSRFLALEQIASYRNSSRFVKRPIQNKYAFWNGSVD